MLTAKVQCRGTVRTEIADEQLRTIDCLRGRLQAERVASKAAKEEAWHLAKRLEEIEKNLAEEIKLRNRAEKRLQCAVKKLRSLKLVDDPASSTSSSPSHCFLGRQEPEGRQFSASAEGQGQCGLPEAAKGAAASTGSDCLSDGSSATLSHQFASLDDGSWGSAETAQSHVMGYKESPNGSLRMSSDDDKKEIDIQEPDSENNMLALVPVSNQPNSEPMEPQTKLNVHDVLLALRTVKQQLLYSLRQRADDYSHNELFTTHTHPHRSSTTWHRPY